MIFLRHIPKSPANYSVRSFKIIHNSIKYIVYHFKQQQLYGFSNPTFSLFFLSSIWKLFANLKAPEKQICCWFSFQFLFSFLIVFKMLIPVLLTYSVMSGSSVQYSDSTLQCITQCGSWLSALFNPPHRCHPPPHPLNPPSYDFVPYSVGLLDELCPL